MNLKPENPRTPPTDGQIFTGPYGGKYRINENGKKVHLNKE
ncbi:MAG TPA: hypothetical protein VFC67_07460 [Prolixibacteraceae bacterium]|nr:hypothetical protein [Prolixibacteraceae bacterium]